MCVHVEKPTVAVFRWEDELPVEVSFGKSVHLLLPITSRYCPPTAARAVCAVNHIACSYS